jgi:hypothetical protein
MDALRAQWLVIGLSMLAAFSFALSSALKHVSAGQGPSTDRFGLKGIGDFIRATVSHPLWLAGIACDGIGLASQATALHLGDLSVVQPLLVSGLVFAVLLRQRLDHSQFTRAEFGWTAVLAFTLGGFLLLAASTKGDASTATADRLPAFISGSVGLALAGACVELGRRQRRAGRMAALLGVAVGIIYAADAALLKAVTDIATRHLLDVLISWQVYAVIALGAAGLLVNQLAFEAGPLVASLPATATVDPLLSIVVGVLVYDEHVRPGPAHGAVLLAMLCLLGIAIIKLARDGGEPASTSLH